MIDPETAEDMTRLMEARRAYSRFRTSCFWFCDPAYRIKVSDIEWVAEMLRRNGNREAWQVAAKLSR